MIDWLKLINEKDNEELVEILQIIQEAKDEGDNLEVFFLDEYPQIEGFCIYLETLGYTCTYGESSVPNWVVSWN